MIEVPRTADTGKEINHCWIAPDYVGHHLLVPADLLERDPLLRLRLNHKLVVIGVWNKAFGNPDKQIHRGDQYQDAECQRRSPMPKNPLQAVIVNIQHPVENQFGCPEQPAWFPVTGRLQKPTAQHRSQRQRHNAGNEDRCGDRNSKFTEQPAENSSHEQDRDENGRERQSHGNDRETDFLRTSRSSFEGSFSHFAVPDDVFQHDDGIVHDEADRKNQCHQRQVVEGIAHDGHNGKCSDNRKSKGQTRNGSRTQISQEDENHHHHERKAQEHGELNIVE